MLDETPTLVLPRGTWHRSIGNRWTSPAFRAPVIAWLDAFVATHGWVERWEVVERVGSVSMYAQRRRVGTLLAEDAETFRERRGDCELVVRALRWGAEAHEVGLTFGAGHLADAGTIASQLDTVRVVFERAQLYP